MSTDIEICNMCEKPFDISEVEDINDEYVCFECLEKQDVEIRIVRCMFDEGAGGILEVIKGGDSPMVMSILKKEGHELEEVFYGLELPKVVGEYIFTGTAFVDKKVGVIFRGEFSKYLPNIKARFRPNEETIRKLTDISTDEIKNTPIKCTRYA